MRTMSVSLSACPMANYWSWCASAVYAILAVASWEGQRDGPLWVEIVAHPVSRRLLLVALLLAPFILQIAVLISLFNRFCISQPPLNPRDSAISSLTTTLSSRFASLVTLMAALFCLFSIFCSTNTLTVHILAMSPLQQTTLTLGAASSLPPVHTVSCVASAAFFSGERPSWGLCSFQYLSSFY